MAEMDIRPFRPTPLDVEKSIRRIVETQQGTPCAAPDAQTLEGARRIVIERPARNTMGGETKTAYLTSQNDVFVETESTIAPPVGGTHWFSYGQGPDF